MKFRIISKVFPAEVNHFLALTDPISLVLSPQMSTPTPINIKTHRSVVDGECLV